MTRTGRTLTEYMDMGAAGMVALLSFINYLPPDSALYQSMNPDDENGPWFTTVKTNAILADLYDAYMANPLLLLAELDSYFQIKSQKQAGSNTEYVLDAIKDCGISKAQVTLASDGRVLSGKFHLEDGNVVSVKVLSMKKTEEKPASFFSPDRKFTSDWIVTDLR